MELTEGSGASQALPFGGRVLVADNSVWQRADRLPPAIRAEWLAALTTDQIAVTTVVKLEVLFSARSRLEFDELEEELDSLRDVPMNQRTCRAALWAIREVWHSATPARISPPDALIAAAVADATWVDGVLHYDTHYDRLAEVFGIDSVWISPCGTIP